jgi:hypothetical protein
MQSLYTVLSTQYRYRQTKPGGKGGRNCLDSRVRRDGNGGVKRDGIGGSRGMIGLKGQQGWLD